MKKIHDSLGVVECINTFQYISGTFCLYLSATKYAQRGIIAATKTVLMKIGFRCVWALRSLQLIVDGYQSG